MVGIKGFNSHKFTTKKYIPGQNYSGLVTHIKGLLEVTTVGYILLG